MSTLHPTRTLPALLPRYVTRFSCIGSLCEDTCCAGWQITVDKKTFNSYRQSSHPELAKGFAEHVKRRRSQASDEKYASIKLTPEKQECPLMQERLCSVQKHLGESYLSHTCFSYPRFSRNFGGQYEQALSLSCPEAARQALLAPDAFDFEEAPIHVRVNAVNAVRPRHGLSLEAMNEVRIFCLKLMRTEGLELWQKLAVLGVFCESLSATLTDGKQADIGALLDQAVAMIEKGQVVDALANLQPNHQGQAMVFAALWQWKRHASPPSAAQKPVIDAISRGLGADATGETTAQQLVQAYSQGIARLPEALQAAPHLLEHYVLNSMFLDLFPFDEATPYESYLQLISRFGLLRLMLAAQCNTTGPLPDTAELVHTVQVFSRRFQHDWAFAKQVNKALTTSGWSNLEKIYGFLRS